MTAGPAWLDVARSHIGVREVPGPASSPVVRLWLAKLRAWWQDDETPWCGVFAAACVQAAGLPTPAAWYRAKAWAAWGIAIDPALATPGTVLVFDRHGGGGHVGFYIGRRNQWFRVLGGNQADGVNEMWISAARCIAARWPAGVPVVGVPVRLADDGQAASINEE